MIWLKFLNVVHPESIKNGIHTSTYNKYDVKGLFTSLGEIIKDAKFLKLIDWYDESNGHMWLLEA